MNNQPTATSEQKDELQERDTELIPLTYEKWEERIKKSQANWALKPTGRGLIFHAIPMCDGKVDELLKVLRRLKGKNLRIRIDELEDDPAVSDKSAETIKTEQPTATNEQKDEN